MNPVFASLLSLIPVLLGPNPATGAQAAAPEAPPLEVTVDGRVELLSLIFRLAGNPEYNQARVPRYTDDVEKQFRPFANHKAVSLARELRSANGVSFDAVMAMAVHLDGTRAPQLRTPLAPWPDGLDRRWSVVTVNRFLPALREFVTQSAFNEFLAQHRSFYEQTERRLATLLQREAHLQWFGEFFGERPGARFAVVPGLLNGGGCYGPHFNPAARQPAAAASSPTSTPAPADELFCILGVWQTDSEGMPDFDPNMVPTVVHEFAHSYSNPFVTRHAAELKNAGDTLFRHVRDKMQSQAYGNGETMLREYMVRACVIRYVHRYQGQDAAGRAIKNEEQKGFLWIKGLVELLGEYETTRGALATNQPQQAAASGLDAFAPKIVAYFNQSATNAPARAAVDEARRPKILSLVPAADARDVDPSLPAIQITFDRPMSPGSWSLVGGGEHFPELVGKPAYDPTGTKWQVAVKLKPDWDYQFMVNSPTYDAFRSREGVPVAPTRVQFRTGPAKE